MPAPSREAVIRALQRIVAADGKVRLAILFGSWARDGARSGSDVDVAVDARDADLWAPSAQISEQLGAEVDVVALSAASIPLLEQLIAEGVVVHEAEHGCAAAWRSSVLAQLETDRPWYHRMRDAWLKRVAQKGLNHGQ